MALAKFLEDNLERLYVSLEESRKQIESIDDKSNQKDWRFIKDKLKKELELVQEEYEKVQKIVFDPDFEESSKQYKTIKSLKEKINKQNSELEKLRQHAKKRDVELRYEIDVLERKLSEERADNKSYILTIKEYEDKLDKAYEINHATHKQLAEVHQKLKASNIESSRNSLKYLKEKNINESLSAEIEKLKKQHAFFEEALANQHQGALFEEVKQKDRKISKLKGDVDELSEWVDMLEKELELKEDKMYCVIDGRISLKGKKELPGSYSNFKKLSQEYAKLTVSAYDKDKLIEKLINQIRNLEARESKLQRSINMQNKNNQPIRSAKVYTSKEAYLLSKSQDE